MSISFLTLINITMSEPRYLNGTFGEAVSCAIFLAIVFVAIAVIWYLIFFVMSFLTPKSSREKFTDQQLASQTSAEPSGISTYGNVAAGRASSNREGVAIGRDPLFNST